MKLEDEKLSAWIDGALDEAEARRIADLAAQDSDVAERAGRLRRLDDLVKTAIPEEPVTSELLERLGLAETRPSNVVDFASERSRRLAETAAAPQVRPRARFWDQRKVAAILVLVGVGLSTAAWFHSPVRQATQPDAAYRVLGDASRAGASANALVMFTSDVDAGEARAIAASIGGTIAGGPTPAGAWKLAIDPARRDMALEKLRARNDVTMAEAVDEGGQP